MQAIFDGISWIIETITTLVGFLWDFIQNTFNFFKFLMLALAGSTEMILTLPYWLQRFGRIAIGVCIIYLIVGRTAGGSDE